MPLETATYISDLNAANPAHTDGLNQADSHMRLIKQVLKNTFPNITGAMTKTQADLSNGVVPIGTIVLWTGSIASIPTGWHLCDGLSGTTDLRDKFVVGAGNAYSQGSSGGSLTTTSNGAHNHPGSATDVQGNHQHSTNGQTDIQGNHNHGGTLGHALTIAEMPNHNHFTGATVVSTTTGSTWYLINNTAGGSTQLFTDPESSVGGNAAHAHDINFDGGHAHNMSVLSTFDGGHSHNVSLSTDGGHTHTATPPFTALYYIQRIS